LPKVRLVFFLTAFLSLIPALADAQDPQEEMLAKLASIEGRLAKLETDTKEILAREEKILTELDRIRIWIRRQ